MVEQSETSRPFGSPDPAQVLDVLRRVLIEYTNTPDFLPTYQVQSAVEIGYSGRLLTDDDVMRGEDEPVGLLLTMASGHEYKLTLAVA
jgi:hypothetical protein